MPNRPALRRGQTLACNHSLVMRVTANGYSTGYAFSHQDGGISDRRDAVDP
jgi:hypothetical protein